MAKVQELISDSMATGLRIIGWIYFLLSLIGSFVLLFSSTQKKYVSSIYGSGVYEQTTNYFFIGAGIASIIK